MRLRYWGSVGLCYPGCDRASAVGEVTGVVELDLPAGECDWADGGDGDRFLVTGKLWDTLYEVRFSQP